MSEKTVSKSARPVEFVLTGITHEKTFRVFAFDRIGEQRERTPFTVRTDLSLLNRYGIPVQELPLLCRGVLDRLPEDAVLRAGAFAETDMQEWAAKKASAKLAAVGRRKVPHRPATTDNTGGAWRGQPVQA